MVQVTGTMIIYILAFSFQIAGAVLLIIFATSTKRENIIKLLATSHIIQKDGNTGAISYNHEVLFSLYRTAYYSKFSVAYIAAGYLLAVFGDSSKVSKGFAAMLIIIVGTVLVLFAWLCIDRYLLPRNEEAHQEITFEELEALRIKPDLESMSNEEIYNSVEQAWNSDSKERE